MSQRFAIGIDLGTTHSALSYLSIDAKTGRGASQAVLPIPQLTAPGTVEPRQLLPSFLYLPNAAEFPAGSLALPWSKKSDVAVGEFARTHGAKVPSRLVSSAKSWLCHAGIDRRAAVLPWGAPEAKPPGATPLGEAKPPGATPLGEAKPPGATPLGSETHVKKISPVEASARYLEHLRRAWEKEFDGLAEQQVIVTVPASFDAAARDLTIEAAKQAGLPRVTLLEEPQAALYAWLEAMGDGWRKQVKPGEVLLVVDVGGGTSDFSLIGVTEKKGNLELERLAVGDHILLGGDNMDLALAYTLNEKLKAAGKNLDQWQLAALTSACRTAKETLYESDQLDKHPIAVPGRGSSLIGGTIKTELLRDELDRVLTQGFFPMVKVDEAPSNARRSGLAQVGLPYAQDAAITRHLGAFLTRQAASLQLKTPFARPSAVLFNGGVFKASKLRARVMETLNAWLGGADLARELPGADLDLAVARGAAYYGWVKFAGQGIRIRGGTARSYYVGVESSMPAVPGFAPPMRALCVAPFGMEEGTEANVPPQEFGLVVGEPTRFRFFSSSTRRDDKVGDFLDDAGTLEELPPIETALEGQGRGGDLVPVNLQAAVTELGALELRCLQRGGKGKWKLELNVRGE